MRIDGLVTRINSLLHISASIWLFMLALVILVDVLGRTLFNFPLAGTAEIVANSTVAIAFLQLSHSIRMGGMLRAEILEPFLPEAIARWLLAIGFILGAILFSAIAWGAWDPMLEAWRIGEYAGYEGSLKVPTYPIRTVLVCMCCLAALNYMIMAWRLIKSAGRRD